MRDGTTDQIRCILVRHGMTASNESGRYLGVREEPLSEKGIEALLSRKAQGCYGEVSAWITSPLSRCVQTGELLWPGKRHSVIAEFREIDFGEWDGKHYLELADDPLYQRFIDSNGETLFPGGEQKAGFILRVMEGWRCMLSLLQKTEWREVTTLGLAVHGGTIMALLSELCGGDYYDYQVPCGEGYCFGLTPLTGEINEVDRIGY